MAESPDPILRYFRYSHLPEALKPFSKPFSDMADWIVATFPKNPERTVALRKLLESKDCSVRAGLPEESPMAAISKDLRDGTFQGVSPEVKP